MVKKEKQKIEYTRNYLKRFCDICDKEFDDIIPIIPDTIENRDITDSELCSGRMGIPILGLVTDTHNFGDCGGTTGEAYDICKDCYKNKIKPLLEKELGLKPRIVQYDW